MWLVDHVAVRWCSKRKPIRSIRLISDAFCIVLYACRSEISLPIISRATQQYLDRVLQPAQLAPKSNAFFGSRKLISIKDTTMLQVHLWSSSFDTDLSTAAVNTRHTAIPIRRKFILLDIKCCRCSFFSFYLNKEIVWVTHSVSWREKRKKQRNEWVAWQSNC